MNQIKMKTGRACCILRNGTERNGTKRNGTEQHFPRGGYSHLDSLFYSNLCISIHLYLKVSGKFHHFELSHKGQGHWDYVNTSNMTDKNYSVPIALQQLTCNIQVNFSMVDLYPYDLYLTLTLNPRS